MNERTRRARTKLLCACMRTGLTVDQLNVAMEGAAAAFAGLAKSMKQALEYHEIRNEQDLERAIRDAGSGDGTNSTA